MAAIAHAMGAVLDERIMKGGDPIASFCGLLRGKSYVIYIMSII